LDRAPAFRPGDVVKGVLDWEKRYRKMRLHTAAHILAAVLYNKYNALITGGDITHEYARDDFNIEGDMAAVRKAFEEAVAEANAIAQRGIDVKVYWLPREEALKIPGVVKHPHPQDCGNTRRRHSSRWGAPRPQHEGDRDNQDSED